MRIKFFVFVFIFFSFISYSNEKNPIFFIENIINETRPALINKDNIFLMKLMNKYLDFDEIAIWIAGKDIWTSLSSEKKSEFLIELKKLMLKTYSNTVYYYIDSDVSFINPNLDEKFFENKKRVQINSIMKKNNKNVNISYRLIKNNNNWLVYDVLIEGISILKSLKTQYSDMIKNKGIDYAINKIIESNKL